MHTSLVSSIFSKWDMPTFNISLYYLSCHNMGRQWNRGSSGASLARESVENICVDLGKWRFSLSGGDGTGLLEGVEWSADGREEDIYHKFGSAFHPHISQLQEYRFVKKRVDYDKFEIANLIFNKNKDHDIIQQGSGGYVFQSDYRVSLEHFGF